MNNLLVSAFDFSSIFGNFLQSWYLYLALFVLLASLITFFVLRKPEARNSLSNTQKIVYVAVLTALCTVVNCFTWYPVSYIAISFVPTITFVAGYLLGSKLGFAVGFIGDLIGAIVYPSGAYNPIIGLANGFMGFIPGVIFERSTRNAYLLTAISAVTSLIICTSGLNTFGLWLMFGMGKKSFFVYLWARLPFQLAVAAGNAALCCLLVKIMPRILPKNKFYLDQAARRQSKEEEKETRSPA